MKSVIRALTIAGFDGSGGAGIQADIKTFSALGCYAMSVLTALPIQNTTGVKNIYKLPISSIEEQCDAIFDDIGVDVVKIGMLFNAEVIKAVSKALAKYKPKFVVVDPVMVAKSGHYLLEDDAVEALIEYIFPISTIITPNIPEASRLVGKQLDDENSLILAAKQLSNLGPEAVLIKGGHGSSAESKDLLHINGVNLLKGFRDSARRTRVEHQSLFYYKRGAQSPEVRQRRISKSEEYKWLTAKRIHTTNDHGTGCTLSAAIAAFLGHGCSIDDSVVKAKNYITSAINYGKDLKIGRGHGPVDHFWNCHSSSITGRLDVA